MAFRPIVFDAFPGLGQVKSKAPRPIKGLPGPRFPQNSRSGWIPGWPRIPDLPQVKSKIPHTNRIESRGEAERRKAAEAPRTQPARDPTAFQDQDERLRRLREAAATGKHDEVRRIRATESARQEQIERRVEDFDRGYRERRENESGIQDGAPIRGEGTAGPDERLLPALPRLSHREQADVLLRAGDYEGAAQEYLKQLDEREDSGAARSLGVALLLADRPRHASLAMLEAYRMDLSLAANAFDESVLPPDVSARRAMSKAVSFATRSNQPGSWLLAAVLAQAQGRPDVAARFVERGRAAALEAPIADALVAALAKETTNAQAGGS
jgi:hypothetical protein